MVLFSGVAKGIILSGSAQDPKFSRYFFAGSGLDCLSGMRVDNDSSATWARMGPAKFFCQVKTLASHHENKGSRRSFALLGWTVLAMVAFATNAILGRMALKGESDSGQLIDPVSYTSVRILAGALVLLLIQGVRRQSWKLFNFSGGFSHGRWFSPLMLFVYAAGFSLAYVGLDTAAGTLILFAFVQMTLISTGILKGEFPRPLEWTGLVLASCGLVYLVFPSLQTPLLKEALLMALAGIAWGFYSFLGKTSKDSISDTAFNFVAAVPVSLLMSAVFFGQARMAPEGVWLAAASGALASGLGYVLWYTVLPSLRSTEAAAVQLSVPVVAAVGGVLLVGEELSGRTVAAGILILLGIGLTIQWKK